MAAYFESTRVPEMLTEQESALLLKATSRYRENARDHIMFALALGTALREHEIAALTVGDIYTEDGRARETVMLQVFKGHKRKQARNAATSVTTEGPVPKPRGGRRRPPGQQIILPDPLRAKLDKFYRWKIEMAQSVAPDARLLVSRQNAELSAKRMRDAFAKWQVRAGFDRHLTFHALRHTSISNVYRKTKDPYAARDHGRHEDLRTSGIYTHLTYEDRRRAVNAIAC